MRVRTGIDVVSIDDLARSLSEGAMLEDVWTPTELASASNRADRLAGQWAAKEAVMKVLQVGIGQLSPLDIEIISHDGRAPSVLLYGPAAQARDAAHIADLSISITHERGLAAAVAVALTED